MLQLLSFFVTGLGILLCLLAIPMALGKTRPNHYYGFRTKRTLADRAVWDAANRYAGKALLLAGACSILCGVVMLLVSPAREALAEGVAATLGLTALLGPLSAAVIASFRFLRRIP